MLNVFTIGGHLVFAFLLGLQIQEFHHATCAVTANLETSLTQVLNQRGLPKLSREAPNSAFIHCHNVSSSGGKTLHG
jgi:hypothetical protein